MAPRIPRSALTSLAHQTANSTSTTTAQSIRHFSLSPIVARTTVRRRELMAWLSKDGENFRRPTGKPNYIPTAEESRRIARNRSAAEDGGMEEGADASQSGGRERFGLKTPFPQNEFFKSQPVLSESLKEAIYGSVMISGKSVREASEQFKVSMERVAAVVRMKQMEREWLRDGKQLAPYLNDAIMKMLPQTPVYNPSNPSEKRQAHEPINDLPVHPYTQQQIFWPVSESRHFTRVDAGRVFKPDLLPSDVRIPHPQMVDRFHNVEGTKPSQEMENIRKKLRDEAIAKEVEKRRRQKEDFAVVEGPRTDYVIENVQADWVGKDGRSRKGVGARYGMPHEDRKPGLIKIPTRV